MTAHETPQRWSVSRAGPEDLEDLLRLMRAYCRFYRADPSDAALLEMSRALIADPRREGVQLIARDSAGAPAGFATLFWSWSTAAAARIGVMNDLWVEPVARGAGLAEQLMEACATECSQREAVAMEWQTAPDNLRAQRVYDRVGSRRADWLCYSLPIAGRD